LLGRWRGGRPARPCALPTDADRADIGGILGEAPAERTPSGGTTPFQAGAEQADTGAVNDAPDAPIRACAPDDETLARLDAFVVALGEWIDAIQDAEGGGRLEEAGQRARALALEARSFALIPLVEAAEAVSTCCKQARPEDVHAAIVALTDVVRRVRLGHRGAAS
jgi:hypothetical protein